MFVAVSYSLYDASGELRDRVTPNEPLEFICGYAQVLPGLESGLADADVGERRSLRLSPEEAFGKRDVTARLEIDAQDFPDASEVQVGDELLQTGPDGVEVALAVLQVSESTIIADLNHPLAGQRVRFDVEVLEVRPATDEELDAAQADANERIVTGSYAPPEIDPHDDGGDQTNEAGLIQLRRR